MREESEYRDWHDNGPGSVAHTKKMNQEKMEYAVEQKQKEIDKDNTITALQSNLKQAEAENERLREATRWIPVEERLPEIPDENSICSDMVLVTNGDLDGTEVSYYNSDTRKWEGDIIKPTHWMPIPALPEKEGNT